MKLKSSDIGHRSKPSRRFDANLIDNKLNRTKINNDYLTEDVGNQIANQSKDVINKDSLNTAEIIAKKIGIGFADVLGNISGELKQGIESK